MARSSKLVLSNLPKNEIMNEIQLIQEEKPFDAIAKRKFRRKKMRLNGEEIVNAELGDI